MSAALAAGLGDGVGGAMPVAAAAPLVEAAAGVLVASASLSGFASGPSSSDVGGSGFTAVAAAAASLQCPHSSGQLLTARQPASCMVCIRWQNQKV